MQRLSGESDSIVNPGWVFVFSWVKASVGGLFLGIFVQIIFIMMLPALANTKPVMAMLPLDFSLGLTLGALQALVLRHHLDTAWLWIWALATGIGVASAEAVAGLILHDHLGLVFGFYRSPANEALTALAVVGPTIGVCLGVAQWLVLMLAGYRSVLWVPANIVCFTAAIAIGDYLAVPEMMFITLLGALAGFILGGAFYGLLTGCLLVKTVGFTPKK